MDGSDGAAGFRAALARWRAQRGLSKKQLAARMGFDPSYISHIESGRHRPTEDFARRAESTLDAGNEIWGCWLAYLELRSSGHDHTNGGRLPPPAPVGGDLVVAREVARLRYDGDRYSIEVVRVLRNTGAEPVVRYPVRIAVDRHPGETERSNRMYRADPLTADELAFTPFCDDEPMAWQLSHDRDAVKEFWLLFENAGGRFPLYPGRSAELRYRYQVGDDKWGRWFQRAIRLPTGRLEVELAFPAALEPAVWGTQTSLTVGAAPFRNAITRTDENTTRRFSWATDNPTLQARYRLEWRFRGTG